jgi:hypothetical protein
MGDLGRKIESFSTNKCGVSEADKQKKYTVGDISVT